jgi:membrane protein YqaA with SNARE-associated domain
LDYFAALIDRLYEFLVALGWPGLLGLAFLDSAAVPTGGGPDLAVLLLTSRGGADIPLLVAAAVVGSTLGCLVMYLMGHKGGEKLLECFNEGRRRRVREKINQYGFWAIFLAVIGPPPYPTKLFILSSGVFHMRMGTMLLAVFLGRILRYSLTAAVGYYYGEKATDFFRDHYPAIFLGLVAVLVIIFLVRGYLLPKVNTAAKVL